MAIDKKFNLLIGKYITKFFDLMEEIIMERTLVLVKPDGVERKLIGEIIRRFERATLQIDAMKLVNPKRELLEKHYTDKGEYLKALGQKTLSTYKEYNMDPIKELGTDSDLEIGKMVREWLIGFMMSGPVLAMVLSGNHAVDAVRSIVGKTIPLFADVGTIRGDFSLDSPDFANAEKRPVKNLVHASGNTEEAGQEIALWFSPEEFCKY